MRYQKDTCSVGTENLGTHKTRTDLLHSSYWLQVTSLYSAAQTDQPPLANRLKQKHPLGGVLVLVRKSLFPLFHTTFSDPQISQFP